MVVRDLDFVGITVLPAETNSILLIDANAVLTFAVTGQPFKAVAWRDRELPKVAHAVQLRELSPNDGPEVAWTRRSCAT